MNKYIDHDEWEKDMSDARNRLREIDIARPNYYSFYRKLCKLNRDNWRALRFDKSSDRREKLTDVFYETMEQWARFEWKDSKIIWKLVKDHHDTSKDSPDYFDTKRMYDTMKTIREKEKVNEVK